MKKGSKKRRTSTGGSRGWKRGRGSEIKESRPTKEKATNSCGGGAPASAEAKNGAVRRAAETRQRGQKGKKRGRWTSRKKE